MSNINVAGKHVPGQETVLTVEAVDFLADLNTHFRDRVLELLENRKLEQARCDDGKLPNFLDETRLVRDGDWTVAPLPDDILDRRVEITGPVDRKMIINALNSGANVFMADFEDSSSPTWENMIHGQKNLRDAVNKTIEFTNKNNGKHYSLNNETAVLFVRPRGWHLFEKHFVVDGYPIPAGIFDFGLYFFHNIEQLLTNGTGPYFYLPKMQSHLEARLWNDIFVHAQEKLNISVGTIKATVLLETLPAAFQIDEILYELRDHSAGLNCGRCDYIFSYIKTLKNHKEYVLPDRDAVTMTNHFMNSYAERVISVCHRRGVHAMGGMAAQIPIRNNDIANEAALNKVRQDKLREVRLGHDGTWVAHPGLISIAREVFDTHMAAKNQIGKLTANNCTAEDLLTAPVGEITEAGLRKNINVGILYIEAWLRGNGCVPLYNLMEDAATAEISRTQVWQWLHHSVSLSDSRELTKELFDQIYDEEVKKCNINLNTENKLKEATDLFYNLCTASELEDFLTLPAYELIRGEH